MRNRDLAREWAHGATSGKGSNMFIDGDTIYSYGEHFPMARRMGRKNYLTLRTYSSSTSRHQSYVRQASYPRSSLWMYIIPLQGDLGRSPAKDREFHDINIQLWYDKINDVKEKLPRKRKFESSRNEILDYVDQLKEYMEEFNIDESYVEDTFGKIPTNESLDALTESVRQVNKSYQERIKKEHKKEELDLVISLGLWKEFKLKNLTDYTKDLLEKDGILHLRLVSGDDIQAFTGEEVDSNTMRKYYKFYTKVLSMGGTEKDTGFKMFNRPVHSITPKGVVAGDKLITRFDLNRIISLIGE